MCNTITHSTCTTRAASSCKVHLHRSPSSINICSMVKVHQDWGNRQDQSSWVAPLDGWQNVPEQLLLHHMHLCVWKISKYHSSPAGTSDKHAGSIHNLSVSRSVAAWEPPARPHLRARPRFTCNQQQSLKSEAWGAAAEARAHLDPVTARYGQYQEDLFHQIILPMTHDALPLSQGSVPLHQEQKATQWRTWRLRKSCFWILCRKSEEVTRCEPETRDALLMNHPVQTPVTAA